MMRPMAGDGAERSWRGGPIDPRFEQAPVALLVADSDGAVLAANARWRRLAGIEGKGARGSGWLLAVPELERSSVAAAWICAFGSRNSRAIPAKAQRKLPARRASQFEVRPGMLRATLGSRPVRV